MMRQLQVVLSFIALSTTLADSEPEWHILKPPSVHSPANQMPNVLLSFVFSSLA